MLDQMLKSHPIPVRDLAVALREIVYHTSTACSVEEQRMSSLGAVFLERRWANWGWTRRTSLAAILPTPRWLAGEMKDENPAKLDLHIDVVWMATIMIQTHPTPPNIRPVHLYADLPPPDVHLPDCSFGKFPRTFLFVSKNHFLSLQLFERIFAARMMMRWPLVHSSFCCSSR